MQLNGKFFLYCLFYVCIWGCKKNKNFNTIVNESKYAIIENKIYNYNNPVQLIGANGLYIFSAGASDMKAWNMDIVREFVGNVQQAPLTGNVLLDNNGAYLYPLQRLVDSNRIQNMVTILCPFIWNGQQNTYFTGAMPTQTSWYNSFKTKLEQWATQFKDQPDVWLEVWNEPYRYDRADGYTDDMWVNQMNELVSVIRNTGNQNIIVVPCAEQGQDESVLNKKGVAFLNGKKNILFDIHAYEKWLWETETQLNYRFQNLQTKKLPIIFGEVAPMNDITLMNPNIFLNTMYNRGISCCAWLWKYDANDTDALLTATGLPNNNNNNNWGTMYKNLCTQVRKP